MSLSKHAVPSKGVIGGEDYSRLSPDEKIQIFIEEARRKQTLYGNFEGFYSRRVVDIKRIDYLKELIRNMLFYDEKIPCLKEEEEKKLIIDNMATEMVNISRRYSTLNEIHFTVIWVYYYLYASGETKQTPLLKIYKTKDLMDAIFLDINLKLYHEWDDYLTSAPLPKALLCIPRNGTYTFQNKGSMLDLSIVRSSGNNWPNTNKEIVPAPFSDRLVRPLLEAFRSFKEAKKNQFKNLLDFMYDTLKKRDEWLPVLICCLEIFVNLFSGKVSNAMIKVCNALRSIRMLLDKCDVGQLKMNDFKSDGWANKFFEGNNPNLYSPDHFRNENGKFFSNLSKALRLCAGAKDSQLTPPDRLTTSDNSSRSFKEDIFSVDKILNIFNGLEDKSLEVFREIDYEGTKLDVSNESGKLPLTMFPAQDFSRNIYLVREATIPLLEKGFSIIFGKVAGGWSYKPKNNLEVEVVDDKGNFRAVLHYITNSSAIVYLP